MGRRPWRSIEGCLRAGSHQAAREQQEVEQAAASARANPPTARHALPRHIDPPHTCWWHDERSEALLDGESRPR